MRSRIVPRLLLALDVLLAVALATSFFVDPYALIHQGSGKNGQSAEDWKPTASLASKPFNQYESAWRGKSFFRYSLEEEAARPQKNIVDDFKFLGMSRPPSGPRGFLQNTVTNQTRSVAEGDMIGDYRVTEIRSDGILLSKGGEQIDLKR